MKPKDDRQQLAQPPAAGPAPRKRFRIEKLEERIAPGAVDTRKCFTEFKCTLRCL